MCPSSLWATTLPRNWEPVPLIILKLVKSRRGLCEENKQEDAWHRGTLMTWSGAQRIASGARCPFLGRCSPRQKALGVAASPMEAGLAHCEHPARRNGLRPPHPAALERSARPTTRLAHPRRPQAASCSPSSTSPCGLKQQPDESTWVAGSSEATCVGRHRVLLPVLIAGEATQPAACAIS